uniref:EGF-like domain-containing protein n=1 Tax=Heterorhabditis bacteriophora TaxID=37862 RepID=A0A1I7X6R7_HETBA
MYCNKCPTGKVLDCSGSGHLVYNNSTYECQCDGGYNGTSCEIGECPEKNTTLDTFYRTYTVVIGMDTSTDISEWVFKDVNETARIDETSVIWQYQLIIYTVENEVIPLYIGNNYEHFIRSLNYTKWDVNAFMDHAAIDLTRVYESAVSAVGRQSKGLISFYVETADITVTLSEFYSVAQQYRQQLYIFRKVNDECSPNEEVIKAAFSTGGCYISYSDGGKNIPQVFSDILGSETSLNIQSFNRAINTVTVENKAYAFMSGLEITGLGPTLLVNGLYKLSNGTYNINITNSTLNWISVVEINGTVPLHAILSSRKDDTDTAVGSDTTAAYQGISAKQSLPSL